MHVIPELQRRMEILVIGTDSQLEETKKKFGATNHYRIETTRSSVPAHVECVFDFLNEESVNLSVYATFKGVLFVNSVFTTLHDLRVTDLPCNVFGFCGLPTFLDRPVLEVTLHNEQQNEYLLSTCGKLGTDYRVVADTVGMVTPRVICMIINEAYYTVEEGTATREDIDMAMKLGTNYPFGPFEWSERIGKKNIIRLLNAVQHATRDDRYKMPASLC